MPNSVPGAHGHFSPQNLTNAALCVGVGVVWKFTVDAVAASALRLHPLLQLSALLFLDVSVLFWLVGLVQGSVWLIDPFWTWIPFMIVYAYLQHPSLPSTPLTGQFWAVTGLLLLWSLRLTHSYFRREGWKFGAREDWRYTLRRTTHGRHWWWISFWEVCILQQLMLTGITLPVYSVLFHPSLQWSWPDSVGVCLCIVGVAIAFFADNVLFQYSRARPRPSEVLRTGLWKWSRHPNYFGEMLFWWSLALFSLSHGDVWALLGPLFNSLIMVPTTHMTEQRMIQNWQPSRAALYRRYQKTTSAWIPLPNSWDEE